MTKSVFIEPTDQKIVRALMLNSRIPFLELARDIGISGAAVHQRVQKLTESGIIQGFETRVNPGKMGYQTCAFAGIAINLVSSTTHENVFRKIMEVPEIVECHHVSGKYSLLVKIYARSNEHLKQILIEKIQSVPEIVATETFVSLEEGFTRQIPV